jgi:hypothetical protein
MTLCRVLVLGALFAATVSDMETSRGAEPTAEATVVTASPASRETLPRRR